MPAIPIDALTPITSAQIDLHKLDDGRYEASVPAHPKAGTVVEESERWATLGMQKQLMAYAQAKAKESS